MGNYTVEDEPDRTIPEDTILRAELKECKEDEVEFVRKNDDAKSGKKKGEKDSFTKLLWWFEIVDDAEDGLFKGRKVRGETPAKFSNHPNNTARNWAEGLLGRDLQPGDSLDPTEDLTGLLADITIRYRHYTKGGEERVIEEVDEVMAVEDSTMPF